MGSVQINSDGAGGQKASRAYTVSTASDVSVYCRVKFPSIASSWAVPWDISSGAHEVALILNGGVPQLEWDNDGTEVAVLAGISASNWYDVFVRKNGSNVDIYYKVSTAGSWSGPTSAACVTFTPTTITFGDTPLVSVLANVATRYGKIVVWDTNQSSTIGQAEANFRELQDTSGGVFFYNSCSSASAFGTDGSGRGNNLTITGTPADNSDDPNFPAASASSSASTFFSFGGL